MLPSQLPHYQGQYRVGYVDIEASGKDEQKHGLLCRIYYPTNESKSHQQSWLPQPWKYSKGYGDFLKLPRVATAMLLYPSMFNIRLPAIRHAEILAKSQVETFPVAIFSHGLGGMRTTYSNFCGNLASRGFIVVAPEHSDGTACYTNRKAKHDIPYYHITIADKLEHETPDEGLFRIRSQQLEHRKDEIFNAIDIIKKINDGNLDHINNIDVEPKERDDHDLMVKRFKNRIDMNKMIMAGHSFGAATAIHAMNFENPFKCAVLLDPWMYAVPKKSYTSLPILNFQSHDYMTHSSNKDNIFGLIKETKHQDVSDFNLAFTRLFKWFGQAGNSIPKNVHAIVDAITFSFVKSHIGIQGTVEAQDADMNPVLYGEEAWNELYKKLDK